MNYLVFDLLVLALPAAVLLLRATTRPAFAAPAGLALLALVWTAPWDEHLVRTGVWSYSSRAVLARLGSVPLEEYLFVVLEVALVAAWGAHLSPRAAAPAGSRTAGALAWAAAGLVGLGLLVAGGHVRYAGLLLVWAAPPLALQHAVGGDVLAARRAQRLATVVPVALWLAVADRFALAQGIWTITPASSLGAGVLGLPAEEAVFFALTCLLVTDGLLLGADRVVLGRVRALVRHPAAAVATGRAG